MISVDLPAPLSPSTHVTSPGYTATLTSSSALTLPKYFEIDRTSSIGVFVGASLGAGVALLSLMIDPPSLIAVPSARCGR